MFDLQGLAGTSGVFAGYDGSFAPTPRIETHRTTSTITYNDNQCTFLPEGATWSLLTSEGRAGSYAVYLMTVVTCHNGFPTYTAFVAYVFNGKGGVVWNQHPLAISLRFGDTVKSTLAEKGDRTVGTIQDLTTGQSASARVRVSGATSFGVGVSDLGADGQQTELPDFEDAAFTKVQVDRQGVGDLDPRSVSLVDPDGTVLAVPGSIHKNARFTVEFV
jgi:hypothetical protein